MKRLILIALGLLALAMTAHAGELEMHIYSDAALTDSTIIDNSPRIMTLYVVESGSFHATGVMFSTEPTAGFTGVWLGDTSSYFTVGNSQTYINIGYGTCHPLPVVALTMTYQFFGTSAPCSELRIAPPDGWPCVGAPDVDCSFTEACIRDIHSLHVNCPVATEPTTWGRVKALYR